MSEELMKCIIIIAAIASNSQQILNTGAEAENKNGHKCILLQLTSYATEPQTHNLVYTAVDSRNASRH